ncbi:MULTISPECIES: response regulator transcription factor [Clostridia]|uniref:response regulator transcription factor n=1 Tax=Clostridia TaxID=186801 RepID=UPI000EA1FBA6|nr:MULTISPECIES: response regulator transcription factor [Clostridia]NBJ68010.1 DNA-binding response regulator [Roseburia sp. 1XD42-34]RKI82453.1 DNA-binding response regulator [Clostridium sp. 1xD42-85]
MSQITILVADDEKEIADLISIHLKKEGYNVITATDGAEALQLVQEQVVHLVILDIMMPKMDGYEVTQRIREKYQMPIIFVSAKTSDFDKVKGLVIGADDYMTKPFTPMELVARVNAQLRRFTVLNGKKDVTNNTLEYGELCIDKDQRSVILYEEEIELTPKEFDILFLLASHPKKVFDVETIFQQVWGELYYEGANTVMVHIRTLRKKLKEDQRKDKWIKTVWGVGYSFHG